MKIWLGEYSHTESTGGTFPMALTAMSAKDWKLGLDFSTRKVISFDFILVKVITIVEILSEDIFANIKKKAS